MKTYEGSVVRNNHLPDGTKLINDPAYTIGIFIRAALFGLVCAIFLMKYVERVRRNSKDKKDN